MTKSLVSGISWAEKALRELSQRRRVYSYQWHSEEKGCRHTLSVEGKVEGSEKLDRIDGDFSDGVLSQCASSTNEVARLEVKERISGMLARFETKDATTIASDSA